jgi:HD-GYP domain-containing protein (c-di-GMP phosphodiesterase class II)/putative methionine-R-sulfoxide reductase with GAF domain
VREDPDYLATNSDIRSELCVPITTRKRVIGVVNVESTQPNHYSESDERMLVAVAGELGIAIEKILLLEAERGRRRELEVLNEISAAVREAHNRDDLLEAVLDRILDVLDCQGAGMAFRDLVDGSMLVEQGRGQWEAARGLRLPAGAGIGEQVAASQQTYVTADTRTDPLLYRQGFIKATPCLLCLPLVVEGQTISLLYLGRSTPFQPNDITLAESMGNIVAGALHRIQLNHKTEEQLARLTGLRTIDQSILSASDLTNTLDVLLEKVTSLLQVDAADIFLYDPASRILRIGNECGYAPALGHRVILRLGESHAGKAALEQAMEFIPDLSQIEDSMTARLREIGETFTSYVALPLMAKDHLKGVLQLFHRTRLEPTADWMEFLKALGDQAAIAIDNAMLFDSQQKSHLSLIQAYEDTIDGWSRALDLRDRETEGHSQRVSQLTIQLAKQLGIPEKELPHIRRGAQLHDIGKMAIPDSILHKPGPLTADEWDIMRRHPLYALDFLYPIDFLQPSLEIPYSHHEKWDGTGYPQGLYGEDIPLSARVFAVVDVWDALTHNRPYRPAWPVEKALDYLRNQRGLHFDPRVVDAFLSMGPTRTPEQILPHDP